MQITDDLDKLLDVLPQDIQAPLRHHTDRSSLIEIVLDLGRYPEARFTTTTQRLSDEPVSRAMILDCIHRLGDFGQDNRAGIEQTLHRISALRNRKGEVIGLTCRVGRAVFGTIEMIRELVESGRSLLLLGRPGVGKTTALREIARVLADDLKKRVVIIDTSNEIAGDGDIPHPAIGHARRMQVARPELQHQVMIEAVENHMPEVVVIDEIGTELEALAARTIAERGVQLVGTAHGNQITNLIKNPTLADLIGGIQSVTLGDDEARRRGTQKTVLERKAPPTFEIAIEMLERQRWVVHEQVAETVDSILRGRQLTPQIRTVSDTGKVVITRELSQENTIATPSQPSFENRGWRSSGHMVPLPTPPKRTPRAEVIPLEQDFQQLLEDYSLAENRRPAYPLRESSLEPQNSELEPPSSGLWDKDQDDRLRIYPYGISRHPLEHVIRSLNLPVLLTKDLSDADVVLALRSHIKHHSKLKQLARTHQIPIHTIKASSIPQIAIVLKRMLRMDEPGLPSAAEISLFTRSGSDDELEALEETRLAVEQIVLPKGQPVELLPRSAKVRRMQHELVEHYHLKSSSFGEEPNRRIRIYPA